MQDQWNQSGWYFQLRYLCRSRSFCIGPRDHPERMPEMHAGASQGLIPFDFPDKTKEPEALISSNSGSLIAGDERIELPPKVLETPIIPFDQSPIYKMTYQIRHLFYFFLMQKSIGLLPYFWYLQNFIQNSVNQLWSCKATSNANIVRYLVKPSID